MIKHKELGTYCKKMLLKFSIEDECKLILDDNSYEIVDSENILFDEDFKFLPIGLYDCDGFVYQFCGKWFLQISGEEVSMKELKYLGSVNQKIIPESFLGVHSGNELLNGVGLYSDWIKKAKFLGIHNLGICEKNNIGGSMEFQKQCFKNGIKPIIGLSLDIKNKDDFFSVKCYCKDFQGWQNLLKFTYKLNVEKDSSIEEFFLEENKEGLHIVIDPKSCKFRDYSKLTNFYQLDTVKFEEEEKDSAYLDNLEKFILSEMKPVLINDAYYIEQSEWEVREKLWGIAKSFDYRTKNQYFKNLDEIAIELLTMFEKSNNSWIKLFNDSKKNLKEIVDSCDFKIDTSSRHLPKYVMTEEESKSFSSNEQFFMHLIKKGFSEKGIEKSKQQHYVNRLKKEIDVLKKGNVIDYFLITRDILNFAKSKNILVGIGRGSAGGSLVSYLLGIIQIDPMEFELIFERFLNEGRMGALTECEAFLIGTSKGNIKLNEKSLLKVLRNGLEKNIFVEDLLQGDEILKY